MKQLKKFIKGVTTVAFRRKLHLIWKRYLYPYPSFYKTVKNSGILNGKRPVRLIVSLTSYPARIKMLHETIHTLLSQTLKPDVVVLWLGEEQFPDREKGLPDKLLQLQPFGLTIRWSKDIRSYKKLIPALQAYPDDIIVTADDDVFYHPEWLEKLYCSFLENQDAIHCTRAKAVGVQLSQVSKAITDSDTGDVSLTSYSDWEVLSGGEEASFRNFFTGVGGVLYPPYSLHKDIGNEELFMKLAPTNDDIWFWTMALLNYTEIKVIGSSENLVSPNYRANDNYSLNKLNTGGIGSRNDIQLKQVFHYYPQLKDLISDDKNRMNH